MGICRKKHTKMINKEIDRYEELRKKYDKAQEDIKDLSLAVEALQKVIDELRIKYKNCAAQKDEIFVKYRALMESYHRAQGW